MGKNLLIVFAILSLISLSQSSLFDFKYRDFLQAFLSKVEGKSVELQKQCFSDRMMDDLRRSKEALEKGKINRFVLAMSAILPEIYSTCPTKDISAIIKAVSEQMKHISLITEENISSEMIEISKIIVTAIKAKEHSAKDIGEYLGDIVYHFLKIKWTEKPANN